MSTDLRTMPLILAGPMVRRVGPDAAHVWVALRRPRDVTLSVFDHATGATRATGTAATFALGAHLHVALVSARGPLSWGQRYLYDLRFNTADTTDDGPCGNLHAPRVFSHHVDADAARAHAIAGLSYAGGAHALPGFCLPPADLEALRVVHGSCRMPHADGGDALVALDTMLGHGSAHRQPPPHLLLLHGDQVYADDVAPAHLAHISQLGDTLLGWQRPLPGVKRCASNLPPGTRNTVIRDYVGSPEPGGANHALGLGEFYGLYLTALSDTCWPEHSAHTLAPPSLRRFVGSLPLVRRALANIATYGIFDDHEVSDDWNLTLEWAERVLSRPMGRRLIANGLGAFAVFFAWGNTPERFVPGAPGHAALTALAEWRDEPADTPSAALLGIPSAASLRDHDPPQLTPPAGGLTWHFRIDGPSFEILVIDGRTRRAFPGRDATALPALLSAAATDQQLSPREQPVVVTILVSSSVLLPVPRPWYVRAAQWLSYGASWLRKGLPDNYMSTYGPDRGDKWGIHTPAFDYLLDRIAARRQRDESVTRVICLTGDVHVAYAAQLTYEGTTTGRRMVLAHLTASGIQRESPSTHAQQRLGYGMRFARPTVAASSTHMRYRATYLTSSDGVALLGTNHLGELRLTWNEHRKHARHVLWWRRGNDPAHHPHTTFVVPLDPP